MAKEKVTPSKSKGLSSNKSAISSSVSSYSPAPNSEENATLRTPLLVSSQESRVLAKSTVSFSTSHPLSPPPITSLNSVTVTGPPTSRSRIHSSPLNPALVSRGVIGPGKPHSEPRLPKRTTKTSQKLTLFPEDLNLEELDEDDPPFGEPGVNEIGSSFAKGPSITGLNTLVGEAVFGGTGASAAKYQTEKLLSRLERKCLPRVTAYCVANAMKFDVMNEWIESKRIMYKLSPKTFDEGEERMVLKGFEFPFPDPICHRPFP